jgi:hypothetical protein
MDLHPLAALDEPGLVKLCHFPAVDDHGNRLVEMFYHPDQLHHSHMDKIASPFLPEIREYLDRLTPDPNCIYSLVNALGSFEYWSSNINGDAFEEEMLIHRGPVWGYETFLYYARPFMHHANKGPNARAFGSVELSAWNPNMHRVELVVKLDRRLAEQVGAHKVIDRIDHGELPDTSMGCKVPFDLCSITTDWDLYRQALRRFDPKKHRHPGMAVLEFHKRVQTIRGLSVTRDDYSEYLKFRMNQILPDGRKICAFNPYPRFFDISYVFIGADKTSKMMAKLAEDWRNSYSITVPANYGEHKQPATYKGFEKAASSDPFETTRALLRSFKKRASQRKRAEIIKDVVPSQFMGKAVPVLERSEPDLPRETLDRMSECSLPESLSTPTMLGMTLKPREFQRIVICRMGRKDLADELDDRGKVFGPVDEVDRSTPLSESSISPLIAKLLRNAIEDRSVFGPVLQRRMIRITITGIPKSEPEPEEAKDELLDKVSAAYNGYREQVIEKIADLSKQLWNYPDLHAAIMGTDVEDIFVGGKEKLAAGINPKLLIGAIPATYLLSALAKRKVRREYMRGGQPGMLTEMLAEHPHLAASAVGLAALKASGSDLPGKILKGAITVGKRVAGLG